MVFQSGLVTNQQFIKCPVVFLLTDMRMTVTKSQHNFLPTVIVACFVGKLQPAFQQNKAPFYYLYYL